MEGAAATKDWIKLFTMPGCGFDLAEAWEPCPGLGRVRAALLAESSFWMPCGISGREGQRVRVAAVQILR